MDRLCIRFRHLGNTTWSEFVDRTSSEDDEVTKRPFVVLGEECTLTYGMKMEEKVPCIY